MSASTILKGIDYTVSKLLEAEQSGNAEAVQKAYEELFKFCRESDLDLNAVISQARERLLADSGRGADGVKSARAPWRMGLNPLR